MDETSANSAETLFNVLFAWKCSSTHHKLALDALKHIRGDAGKNWKNLCLSEAQTYLDGSKAPDDKFKDFKNHVLHVRDNYWGGAIGATRKWYAATVEALRARKWSEAVYSAGVLSHYFTDPIQPFHTGQSEAEGIVHRAAEWSIACAYRELTDILEENLGGWPEVTLPVGDDWLDKAVRAGADLANPHYEVCIDHYDLKKGVKDPPAGLDQEIKDRIAGLIGHAVVGYARVMERALAESQAVIPATNLTLASVLAKLTIPVFWITKKMKNAKERAVVEAMFKEFEATGKVIKSLSEDDKTVRTAYAEEVLKKPLAELDQEAPRPVGSAHGIVSPARPIGTQPQLVKKPFLSSAPSTTPPPASPILARRTLPETFELPRVERPPVRTPTFPEHVLPEPKQFTTRSSTPTSVPLAPQDRLEQRADSLPPPHETAVVVNEQPRVRPSQPVEVASPTRLPSEPARTDEPRQLRADKGSPLTGASLPSQIEGPITQSPLSSSAVRQRLPAAAEEAFEDELPQVDDVVPKTKPIVASQQVSRSRPDKYYLTEQMPVERAPSIGAKTAALLEAQGIRTVGDLLDADPDELAVRMGNRDIDGFTILTWQIQADLCCDVPNLRGHDAQIIAACCISQRSELAAAHPATLFRQVEAFVQTSAGQRILRGSESPDLAEVTDWIEWARRGGQSKAA